MITISNKSADGIYKFAGVGFGKVIFALREPAMRVKLIAWGRNTQILYIAWYVLVFHNLQSETRMTHAAIGNSLHNIYKCRALFPSKRFHFKQHAEIQKGVIQH